MAKKIFPLSGQSPIEHQEQSESGYAQQPHDQGVGQVDSQAHTDQRPQRAQRRQRGQRAQGPQTEPGQVLDGLPQQKQRGHCHQSEASGSL